jgi:TonB family protein
MITKRIPLIACTLILVVAGGQAQTPSSTKSPQWKIYTLSDEDFSVALPTLPAVHTSSEFLERTKKSHKIRMLGSYADGVVYVIHVFENPEPRKSLESFIEKRKTSESTTRSYSNLALDGFSGKADSIGGRQFFATEDRFYEFMAFGAPENDPRIMRFFSSLSLRKKRDSIEVSDGPGLPFKPAVEVESSDGEAPTPFTGKQVDTKVRLGMKPEPGYTEEARQNAIVGTVVLKCVFASNGSVSNIRTVSGLPYGLTEKAIDAAQKIKFIPAMKDGKYVSMWIQLEYNFNLY